MAVAEITNIVIEKGTDFEETFDILRYGINPNVLIGVSSDDIVSRIRKYPTSPRFETFATSIDLPNKSITISMASNQKE